MDFSHLEVLKCKIFGQQQPNTRKILYFVKRLYFLKSCPILVFWTPPKSELHNLAWWEIVQFSFGLPKNLLGSLLLALLVRNTRISVCKKWSLVGSSRLCSLHSLLGFLKSKIFSQQSTYSKKSSFILQIDYLFIKSCQVFTDSNWYLAKNLAC